jgi:hypothetical protein
VGLHQCPSERKGEGVPVRRLRVPSQVPGHTQTAAKVRGFSPIASGFAAETDWLLEQRGFELLVPPACATFANAGHSVVRLTRRFVIGTGTSNPVSSNWEVCCELDFGRRAPMKALMRRGPQRGPAISGNGVMCQEDPGCEPGPRGGPLTPSSGGGLRRVRAVRRDTPSPRRIRYRTPIRTGIIRSPPTRREYQIFPRL